MTRDLRDHPSRPPDGNPVYIRWVDTTGTGRWISQEEFLSWRPDIVHSVGWVLKNSREAIHLVASYDGRINVQDASVIPRTAIVEIVELRKRRKDAEASGSKRTQKAKAPSTSADATTASVAEASAT